MDTFSALADPTRRHIIELLAANGELSATTISNKFRISAPAISQHLKILREAKLVTMKRKAQQRLYQINPDKVNELEEWIAQLRKTWEERFTLLDTLLAKEVKKNGK